MPLILFYTVVQKSQKWPKTQIKGGSCLKKKAQQYFLSPSCPCSMHALTSM